MRGLLVLWHRWFGLTAALWLFLLGGTGAILVFHSEIDHALNPDIFTAAKGPSRPITEIAAAAAAARPGHVTSYIELPHEVGEPALVHMSRRPDLPDPAGAQPDWQVFVDPATARVLAARDYNAIDLSRRGITNTLYKFHSTLQLGEWAAWLLGVVALLWVLDHIPGVILAFPNPARWRESFRIRRGTRGHKRTVDLHRAGGLWLLPVTLTLAVSGVYFNLPEQFRTVVNAVSPLTPPPSDRIAARPAPLLAPPLDWDAAAARARGLHLDGIGYDPAKAIYGLFVRDRRDIDGYGGRAILVDATSGRLLSDHHRNSGSAGDVVMAWQFPLHSGKAFGWWGRIAIFITGLAVCVFSTTGVMIWARKSRARSRPSRSAVERTV